MMASALEGLDPLFTKKLGLLLANCAANGVIMRPYFGLRDCLTQAKLWRQSRAAEEIAAKIAELRAAGATYLAACLEEAGPQRGKMVTKAIPGLSWHQWGEAVDSFWFVNGAAAWEGAGYDVYRDEAAQLGLTSISWERDHVQLRAAASPLDLFSLAEIDQRMRARFASTGLSAGV